MLVKHALSQKPRGLVAADHLRRRVNDQRAFGPALRVKVAHGVDQAGFVAAGHQKGISESSMSAPPPLAGGAS